MIGMSNGVKKPHKEMQVTTTSQNHKKQTQYHQRERKNYHKLKKKKTPNYQSFKTSGFKTKTALPPHELKTTTDTKPPHTQIHKKLTQNRRKESETTRLKTTKL